MPKRAILTEIPARRTRPALTPEARENEMIALATDRAEEQLRNGTASSQLIVHYLKLGSTKERIEREMLEKQKELLVAKAESLRAAKQAEEGYAEVLEALKRYSGQDDEDSDIY